MHSRVAGGRLRGRTGPSDPQRSMAVLLEWQWVWSRHTDLATFVLPVLVGLLFLPCYFYVDKETVPLWAYIPLVLVGDIMHVWATLLRTLLDTEARRKRWRLFVFSPLLLLAFSFALHQLSPAVMFSFVS